MIRSAVELAAIAQRASTAYLENGTELDTEIAKLASERDLSRIQIQRVVELANHQTNSAMYKQAEDRTFSFKVASLDGVLSRLNQTPETEKVAEYQVVDAVRSIVGKTRRPVDFDKVASAMSAVDPREIEIRRGRTVANLQKIASWIKTHKIALAAERVGHYEDIRVTLTKVSELAKNHVNHGNKFSDLYKLACNYDRDNTKMWQAVFGQVREGLMKLGAPVANRVKNDQIPAEVPVEVINGRHSLLIGLDTLKNKISKTDQLSQRLKLMDTLGPAVVESINHFRNSADVRKYLDETVEKVAALAYDLDRLVEELPELASLLKEAGLVWDATKGVSKTLWKHKGKSALIGGGALTLGALGLAAHRAGKSATKETRDYSPGAYRGVDMGGSTE